MKGAAMPIQREVAGMKISVAVLFLFIVGCASSNVDVIEPGMTKGDVQKLLGSPDSRSFRNNEEAWEYSGVVSIGTCKYTTVWLSKGVVFSLTQRNGFSRGPGCSPGAREVDWGQMPRTGVDIDHKISIEK
jgi:hypothetical protein